MPRRKKWKRCKSYSGFLVGYRCELERGHGGVHEVTTSRTFDTFQGHQLGDTKLTWGYSGREQG
jgi:hypothetical protein